MDSISLRIHISSHSSARNEYMLKCEKCYKCLSSTTSLVEQRPVSFSFLATRRNNDFPKVRKTHGKYPIFGKWNTKNWDLFEFSVYSYFSLLCNVYANTHSWGRKRRTRGKSRNAGSTATPYHRVMCFPGFSRVLLLLLCLAASDEFFNALSIRAVIELWLSRCAPDDAAHVSDSKTACRMTRCPLTSRIYTNAMRHFSRVDTFGGDRFFRTNLRAFFSAFSSFFEGFRNSGF